MPSMRIVGLKATSVFVLTRLTVPIIWSPVLTPEFDSSLRWTGFLASTVRVCPIADAPYLSFARGTWPAYLGTTPLRSSRKSVMKPLMAAVGGPWGHHSSPSSFGSVCNWFPASNPNTPTQYLALSSGPNLQPVGVLPNFSIAAPVLSCSALLCR